MVIGQINTAIKPAAATKVGRFAALGKTADMQHDMTFGTANLPQKTAEKGILLKKIFKSVRRRKFLEFVFV